MSNLLYTCHHIAGKSDRFSNKTLIKKRKHMFEIGKNEENPIQKKNKKMNLDVAKRKPDFTKLSSGKFIVKIDVWCYGLKLQQEKNLYATDENK